MHPLLRKTSLALALAAGLVPAQAGVLTFQDVVFTTTWANNVLTLEIDAARHSGNWSGATMLGALSLKEVGSFQSVSVKAAPQGAAAWELNARELNADGCAGGAHAGKGLCLSGAPIALADNMVFSFAFTGGTPDLDEPHLKVNFFDASKQQVGDLLSKKIAAAPVVVAQPVVPAPVVPAPVATQPAQTAPVTLPASGNTSVPAPETVAVTMPPADTGMSPLSPLPPPPPPPPLASAPAIELEPVVEAPFPAEVPEPYSIALLLGGLALMGVTLRRRG